MTLQRHWAYPSAPSIAHYMGDPDQPQYQGPGFEEGEQLGYHPNLAARSLKLNRRLRIAVYFPLEITSFFDPLRAGVRAAAAASVGVKRRSCLSHLPPVDEGDLELLKADARQKFDGILVAPATLAASSRRFAFSPSEVFPLSASPATPRTADAWLRSQLMRLPAGPLPRSSSRASSQRPGRSPPSPES